MPHSFPAVSKALAAKLHDALQMTDDVALDNVTHDDKGESVLDAKGEPISGRFTRGGPFGAALGVACGDDLEIVGEMRGNNVVGSGIASKHAESEAMRADNFEALCGVLADYKKAEREATVWMLSSGQSCTTCHTKQEIIARALYKAGLLKAARFVSLYGATFDDTFAVAQFFDAQYASAMNLYVREPKNPGNLIQTCAVDFGKVPSYVQDALAAASGPTALVVREGDVYETGTDERTAYDLFSTAEVGAVQKACLKYRGDGVFESWKVDGELYTTLSEIGPLLFAEMGWTKINKINLVRMPDAMKDKQFDTRETPDLFNADFLNIVAGGYYNQSAAIKVLRDEKFVDTAQPMWARGLKANSLMLYNGSDVSKTVLKEHDRWTRYVFGAKGLFAQTDGEYHKARPLAPLRSLMAKAARFGMK
jgi:hypothetical protein